jgi:ornithine decarboxylase
MTYIKPYYAVKSNPHPSLINILQKNTKIGFDVASITEIDKTKIYKNTNDIIYSNPCKSINEIIYARENNIKLLVIDSLSELQKLLFEYKNAEIIIRVKSTEKYSDICFNSKFGCNYNEIDDMLKFIFYHKLKFKGFSYHVGSKCKNMIAHKLTIQDILNNYVPLCDKYNLKLEYINIGGGFTDKFDLINFNKLNNRLIASLHNKGIKIIAEPGRYFSQNYLSLLTSIKSIRPMNGIYKITINDSIYHTFNGIINDKQSFNPIIIRRSSNISNPNLINAIIFGQTCDSGDIICKNIKMPLPDINDILLFENIGAYSLTDNFNGFNNADIITE